MNIKNKFLTILCASAIASSCTKELDLFPQNDFTPEKVYSTPSGYKGVLAKMYGTLAITGNSGPAGSPDIGGNLDEGSQVAFIRGFFNLQCLPTDEAVVAWNDQTIKDFHNLSWTSGDPFLKGFYARPIYNISLINEYLREATDDKIGSKGFSASDVKDIQNSRYEARFLRAFNYWCMLDLFGKSTFITEADKVGDLPKEISRQNLYNYVESELLAIADKLPAIRSAEYGRVDQGACKALLARLYLNAKTYTGTEQNAKALQYAKEVIDGGYTLQNSYPELFMADNDTKKNEFIFTINCDGMKTQAYGNTTFFVHAACGDDNNYYGVNGGWYGYRTTSNLVNKFSDVTGSTDRRALFTTPTINPTPSQLVINDVGVFTQGARVAKFRNVRSDGQPVNDPGKGFSDVDFPVFRLAEMYLIYAEAHLRGGGGTRAQALDYLNQLRFRAYGQSYGPSDVGKIADADMTLDLILDERARELYWEGHRRTDLVRFNKLTSADYLWQWKGGVAGGRSVDSKYNIYPIPAENLNSNPNLSQNSGY